MKTFEGFLNDHKNVADEVNGRTAVIVSTNGSLGVQYWEGKDIKRAMFLENTDKSKSFFISTLKFARTDGKDAPL